MPSPFCFERTPAWRLRTVKKRQHQIREPRPRPKPTIAVPQAHLSGTSSRALGSSYSTRNRTPAPWSFSFSFSCLFITGGNPILSRPPVISPGDSSTFARRWPCRGLGEQRPQRAHDNGRCVPNHDDLDTTFLLPRRDGVLVGHVGSPRGMVPAPSPPSFPGPPSALQAPPTCTSLPDPVSAPRHRTQVVQNIRG